MKQIHKIQKKTKENNLFIKTKININSFKNLCGKVTKQNICYLNFLNVQGGPKILKVYIKKKY